ncbi:ABC transporter substrate-binding protein [Halopiger xanaduensis]|uniref:Ferrichrome-binding protein n=1 Tax=Halopiger xanaduensis (strain DSM 18323 / JCM 14033 / SH-6) TaxID=797210 RepID=F8D864_HALXS|nr:ABC transporter substrate-binding protein [Halopiger xanaduensis]AEH37961.1 ferrichrome-binding protein [Halopiger xanaduensis SH-6]
MSDNERLRNGAPTRRDYVKYGGVIVGGGLLAGCTDDESGAPSAADDAADSEMNSTTDTSSESAEESGYSVSMEPAGKVRFDSVPETWMGYFSTYGDMGIALGQLDGLRALVYRDSWPTALYDTIPGVDVSFDEVEQLHGGGSFDQEVFYELDCDVHLLDPNFVSLKHDSVSEEDFEEIADDVGPVVGNYIRRHGEEWHDYPYYSLYDAFEKIAKLFQERDRYEIIKSVHDEFIAELQSQLPPREERPEIGLLSTFSDFEEGSFHAYPIGDGNGKKQYRDLGIVDAFEPHIDGSYANWDYEQLLEADPDVLVFAYGLSDVTAEEFEERMEKLRSHSVGRRLAAVKNDRLYRGGTSYQGPVINLLQTEAAAKQFYPDRFGPWNGIETLLDEDAQLFDHQRIADVINGTF